MLAAVADDAGLFAELEAGARGCLVNHIEPAALGKALRGVMRGEAAIPLRLVARPASEFRARSATGGHRHERRALGGLTACQRAVLQYSPTGVGTAEIGRRMAISRTTVCATPQSSSTGSASIAATLRSTPTARGLV